MYDIAVLRRPGSRLQARVRATICVPLLVVCVGAIVHRAIGLATPAEASKYHISRAPNQQFHLVQQTPKRDAGKSASPNSATPVGPAPQVPDPRGPGPQVREMLDAIREAITSGQIEDLRIAVELNELKPAVGAGPGIDVITHLKSRSTDGQGYAALAVLSSLLDGPPVRLPLGRDLENNRVWIWPAFAETPLAKLTSAEHVALRKLVPEPALSAMLASGKYIGPRLVIGHDGVWHIFHMP